MTQTKAERNAKARDNRLFDKFVNDLHELLLKAKDTQLLRDQEEKYGFSWGSTVIVIYKDTIENPAHMSSASKEPLTIPKWIVWEGRVSHYEIKERYCRTGFVIERLCSSSIFLDDCKLITVIDRVAPRS
jgi:hypothetical protein